MGTQPNPGYADRIWRGEVTPDDVKSIPTGRPLTVNEMKM